MPHGDRGKRGRSERLQLRWSWLVDPKRHKTEKAQKRAVTIAIHYFFQTQGKNSDKDGVHLIGNWINPDAPYWARRADWQNSDQPGQSLEDFYRTFHGEQGALRAMYETNLKEIALLGAGPISDKAKKSKTRRRVISRVVKRKVGRKFVKAHRVAKRSKKPAQSKRTKRTTKKTAKARGRRKG